MNYYISDTHFGHMNIVKYDVRNGGKDFDSIEEHDELIIANWNDIVKPGDNVYILGDFSWHYAKKTKEILERLNGNKFVIKGNHDRWCKDGACRKLLHGIYDYKQIKDGDKIVILSHYPIMMWNGQHRGAIHLYGHVHNTAEEKDYQEFLKTLKKRFIVRDSRHTDIIARNVGCMKWDYKPVTLEDILGDNYA